MTVRLYNHQRPDAERKHLLEGAAWAAISVASRNMIIATRGTTLQPGDPNVQALWDGYLYAAVRLVLEESAGLEMDLWTHTIVRDLVTRTFRAWRAAQGTPCPLKKADGTCPRCTTRTGCLKRDL